MGVEREPGPRGDGQSPDLKYLTFGDFWILFLFSVQNLVQWDMLLDYSTSVSLQHK